MSKDASTFVALMDETKEDGQKKLVFIDSETALEKEINDPRWQMMQRARWSEDDPACSVRRMEQLRGIPFCELVWHVIYPEKMVMSSFGELPLRKKETWLAVLLLTPPGKRYIFRYNSETDHTNLFSGNGQGPKIMIFQTQTKGIASILMLEGVLRIGRVTHDGTDTILFINGR